MGALLSAPQRLLNLLLPFTNPQTPLLQDLIHTIVLCGTLYFAPQLVELYNHRSGAHIEVPTADDAAPTGILEPDTGDLPIERDLVLQPDDDDPAEPPPLAPTPPPPAPGHQGWAPQPPFADQDQALPDDANFAADAQARPERPRATPANRPVGAKKAKSLARKDQRRAYHEFHRQEAELRRLREAEGKEERDAALLAEQARRAEIGREIAERERAEREKRKEEERLEAEEERARRERVVRAVREGLERGGAVDLAGEVWREGKDVLWGERVVRASGVLNGGDADAYTMITGNGWAVRIDRDAVEKASEAAAQSADRSAGRISLEEFGSHLEKVVRSRLKA